MTDSPEYAAEPLGPPPRPPGRARLGGVPGDLRSPRPPPGGPTRAPGGGRRGSGPGGLQGRRRGDRPLGSRPGAGVVPGLALADRPQPDRQSPGFAEAGTRAARGTAISRRSWNDNRPRTARNRSCSRGSTAAGSSPGPPIGCAMSSVPPPGRRSGGPGSRGTRPRPWPRGWGSPSGPFTLPGVG